jgi:predicted ATPase/DNA-binding winged helix-turn-helix (wHTH) protein
MHSPVEFRFGHFVVAPQRRLVSRAGEPIKLGARAFDLLLALIEWRDQIATKDDLLNKVWRGLTVEEGNLQVQVNALRKALGNGVIATVPGQGYRFVAPVETASATGERGPAASAATARAGNLPTRLPPLIGRDAEFTNLCPQLDRHRLVTIVGAGGIGKTRLALALGRSRHHAAGAWLVELAAMTDPELVAPTVGRLLNVPLGPQKEARAALAEALRDQDLLLILDNAEHLADGVAALAAELLAQAPGVRLLVTSQEPLKLAEEHVFRLGPLELPPDPHPATARTFGAVALFAARAEEADARFVLDSGNVEAVVDICRALDGLPLALELAAARVPLLGVEGVRARLGGRLMLLKGGLRDMPSRHRTLRETLAWSYALLSADEQVLLDRLGIFAGGFSVAAAQAVAPDGADAWSALDTLAALVDKSLVVVGAGPLPRYHLLESTRAFAQERLRETGSLEDARRRHAAATVQSLRAEDPFESTSARLLRTAPEIDNLRSAAAWATGPANARLVAIELFGEADNLWINAGVGEEGEALFRRIATWLDGTVPMRTAARFWLSRSSLLLMRALPEGAEAGMRAAALYEEMGDRINVFRALVGAAAQTGMAGDRDKACARAERARDLIEPGWPSWTNGRVEHALGFAHLWGGAPLQARTHFQAALDLYRRDDGDAFYAMQAWMNVVRCEYDIGDFDALERGCRAYLAHAAESGGPRHAIATFSVHVTYYLGVSQARRGDLIGAEQTLRAALPRLRRAWGIASWTFGPVAFLLARQGRFADAARLLGWMEASRVPGMVASSHGHQQAQADTAALLARALDAQHLSDLKAEGARLTEDSALSLAFPRDRGNPLP